MTSLRITHPLADIEARPNGGATCSAMRLPPTDACGPTGTIPVDIMHVSANMLRALQASASSSPRLSLSRHANGWAFIGHNTAQIPALGHQRWPARWWGQQTLIVAP